MAQKPEKGTWLHLVGSQSQSAKLESDSCLEIYSTSLSANASALCSKGKIGPKALIAIFVVDIVYKMFLTVAWAVIMALIVAVSLWLGPKTLAPGILFLVKKYLFG